MLSRAPLLRSTIPLLLATVACALPSCAAPVDPAPVPVARAVSAQRTAAAEHGWREQVLYLVMPDRFRNGDPSNDDAGAPNCHAPSDPRRFHGGDLEGLRRSVPYLRDLGATAVWTTPLYAQVGRLPGGRAAPNDDGACGYHGYWPELAPPRGEAIEPKLGDGQALTRLVSDLHAAGLRFVLDMVVNHTGDIAALPRERPHWFHDPRTCASLGSPTLFCPLDGHPDFAQERPEVAAFLSDVARNWMLRSGADGVRMDTAKHVPPSYFEASFLPAVHGVRGDALTIAEVFDDGSLAPALPYLDAGFDSAFHFPLRRAMVEAVARGGSIDAVASAVAHGIELVGMERALDLVLLVDNHDVPRFTNEPGWGVPEDEIRRRTMLGLGLIFTLPGIPQLYYGDEIGMYGGRDPDNRRDFPAWAEDPAARARPHAHEAVAGSAAIFDRVRRLAHLRTSTPALAHGGYLELWRQNGAHNPNVFAFARGEGAVARIIVVSNGSRSTGPVSIPVPASLAPDGATWIDELGDGAPSPVGLAGGALTVDLPPRSMAVYRRAP